MCYSTFKPDNPCYVSLELVEIYIALCMSPVFKVCNISVLSAVMHAQSHFRALSWSVWEDLLVIAMCPAGPNLSLLGLLRGLLHLPWLRLITTISTSLCSCDEYNSLHALCNCHKWHFNSVPCVQWQLPLSQNMLKLNYKADLRFDDLMCEIHWWLRNKGTQRMEIKCSCFIGLFQFYFIFYSSRQALLKFWLLIPNCQVLTRPLSLLSSTSYYLCAAYCKYCHCCILKEWSVWHLFTLQYTG